MEGRTITQTEILTIKICPLSGHDKQMPESCLGYMFYPTCISNQGRQDILSKLYWEKTEWCTRNVFTSTFLCNYPGKRFTLQKTVIFDCLYLEKQTFLWETVRSIICHTEVINATGQSLSESNWINTRALRHKFLIHYTKINSNSIT